MPSTRGKNALRLFYFVHYASFGIFLPFFPRWLEGRGLHGLAMGAVLAVVPAVGVLAPIAVGALADSLGLRAQLLRVAAIGAAVMLGLLALLAAQQSSTASALEMVGYVLLVGLFALARTPLFGIADVVALESLGDDSAAFGRLRLFGSLGFVATAISIGFLIDVDGAVAFPAAIGGLYLATFVAASWLPARTTALPSTSWAALGEMKRHGAFFTMVALWQLANSAYDSSYSFKVRDAGLTDRDAGWFWGVGVLAEVLLMAVAPLLLRRATPTTLLVLGVGTSAIRWGLIAFASSFASLFALQLLHAITFALTWMVCNAHLRRLSAFGRIATAQGALTTSVGVGSVIGMLAWPAVYARFGSEVTFVAAGLVAAVALCPALYAIRGGSSPSPTGAGLPSPQISDQHAPQ